ncbi:MAG: VWA domain-containing protein [Solirubrobacteraceae bacterium]|nr:VWA domain-containing protein [Solirubrobacteraceae bacterium]
MRHGTQQSTPDQAVMMAAVKFGRALREFGLSASVDAEHTFIRGLAEIDVRERTQMYWTGHSAFVHSPDEQPVFDAVFERFWEGRSLILEEGGSEHGESDARMQGSHHGGEALPQFGGEANTKTALDGDRTRGDKDIPSAESEDGASNQERGILAAWSDQEILSQRENLEYQDNELAALRYLAQEIKRQAPSRRSRRAHSSPAGHRFDVRGTVRSSLETDGEPFRLGFSAPTLRPRRLLFLCDVSGSMERYSRVLLATLKAAIGAARRAEAFVFATRLTRLTKSLDGRDLEQALDKARASIPDWSGGTRIGYALSEFNSTFGRRGFARGAIVIVVSDGWDRGDPKILEAEVRRIQLQARRLVWINPRPMSVDQQPLAIGMRAAMPYIDDFVPGHDPRAIAGLAQLIGGLANDRPARKIVSPTPFTTG